MTTKARIRLGVITDEFFDLNLGRMGGFGWAARQVARLFAEDPSLGVEVVYMASQIPASKERSETTSHGRRVILRRTTRLANMLAARRESFDLLLTIDYNLAHSVWMRSLPRTPCIVWIRDPRTPDDAEKIHTLRIPDAPDETPQGLSCYDGRSLATIAREAQCLGRKLLFATPAPHLAAKCEGTYGFEPWDIHLLPNAVHMKTARAGDQRFVKSPRPSVAFLARLDPYKRPWVYTAIARRFPDVEFFLLGQSHFQGPGSWAPVNLPPNMRALGHVDGDEKFRILSAAWVTINTSIHEGLAISLLESLACETPLLSCQNPGFVTSRYGIYTGRYDGDGMGSLDSFGNGLQMLIDSPAMRRDLGRSGCQWVESVHSRPNFHEKFRALCRRAGVTP